MTTRFEEVSIVTIAHVDAPVRVTSAELDAALSHTYTRLGMPAQLLENLTGVRARRFWEQGVRPSDAATLAGRKAIEDSGVDPARIGLLINTSVCRDYVEPSVACFVHANLGLSSSCLNFDVTNACLGFLDGMVIAGNMLERGQIDYALVVDAESSREVVESTVSRMQRADFSAAEMREQLATLTVGSGAVAMLLARSSLAADGHRFLGGVSVADTRHNQLCRGTADTGLTDTKNLLAFGVELAGRTWAKGQAELGWDGNSVDLFALHQVSALHTQELSKALGFPLSKTLLIYPELGNVGPAAVPLVLSKAAEAERLARGDRVVLGGIGSGLNCSAMGVIW
ncbi:MAG TPA: 3-oxoacyl-ACP synthase III [Myxococcales bacterium]|jgi:3-oxoacyl-[acyl-carrier-protein] synthase-3|nr:3-oxoacyl-ACP synthase III [Myxococcales bacterium]